MKGNHFIQYVYSTFATVDGLEEEDQEFLSAFGEYKSKGMQFKVIEGKGSTCMMPDLTCGTHCRKVLPQGIVDKGYSGKDWLYLRRTARAIKGRQRILGGIETSMLQAALNSS